MASPRVLITTDDFNLAEEVAALRATDKRVGAVCTFTGTVRDRRAAAEVVQLIKDVYPSANAVDVSGLIVRPFIIRRPVRRWRRRAAAGPSYGMPIGAQSTNPGSFFRVRK